VLLIHDFDATQFPSAKRFQAIGEIGVEHVISGLVTEISHYDDGMGTLSHFLGEVREDGR
jgi:hypothetical protein